MKFKVMNVPYEELFENIQEGNWYFITKESVDKLNKYGFIVKYHVFERVHYIYSEGYNIMLEELLNSDWYRAHIINTKEFKYKSPKNTEKIILLQVVG